MVVTEVTYFPSADTPTCKTFTRLLFGSRIWIVNGVPTTNDLTEPETTMISPIEYDDLSVLVVISGAVGEEIVDEGFVFPDAALVEFTLGVWRAYEEAKDGRIEIVPKARTNKNVVSILAVKPSIIVIK